MADIENIFNNISADCFTIYQIARRLRILKERVSFKIYGGTEVGEKERTDEDIAFLNSLDVDFFKNFTREDFQELFKELERKLEETDRVVLYIPFEVQKANINDIGKWFKENFNKRYLIDFKYDPSLIGGCALVYGGVYKDYSLKTKIAQVRDEIVADFKSYVK